MTDLIRDPKAIAIILKSEAKCQEKKEPVDEALVHLLNCAANQIEQLLSAK